jgi:hypothetical protein
MPVKDIQFGGGHTVQRALHRTHRFEMAAHIEHEAAPAETGHIVDRYRR